MPGAAKVNMRVADTQELEHEWGSFAGPPVGQEFRSLSQHVYDAILQAIVDYKIKPGERLRLDELARKLKVSRTPIRDALSRLMAEGIVQADGRQGMRMTRLGADELTNLYDLRLMCELYAVEKGADRVTPDLLTRLEKCATDIVRLCGSPNPGDRLARSLADRQFHVLLLGLAQNPRLIELYGRLNVHIHGVRIGPSPITMRELQAVNAKEHGTILAALGRRNLRAVKEALRRHIMNARRRAIESLKLDVAR